jgi:hypothetical protein
MSVYYLKIVCRIQWRQLNRIEVQWQIPVILIFREDLTRLEVEDVVGNGVVLDCDDTVEIVEVRNECIIHHPKVCCHHIWLGYLLAAKV